jgi:hypothetical protein
MTGPARIASAPITRLAISVFARDSRFGDRPARIPDTSFSDAARVARPKRLLQ